MSLQGGFQKMYSLRQDGHPQLASGKDSQFAIEHGPVEIVDLPIDNLVIFRIVLCMFTNVYQRVATIFCTLWWTNIAIENGHL